MCVLIPISVVSGLSSTKVLCPIFTGAALFFTLRHHQCQKRLKELELAASTEYVEEAVKKIQHADLMIGGIRIVV